MRESDALLPSSQPGSAPSDVWWKRKSLWVVVATLVGLALAGAVAALALVRRGSSSTETSSKQHKSAPFHQGKHARYKATQFISFTINTLGGVAARGECPSNTPTDPNGICYLGNAQNLTEDVEHRLRIVTNVLERLEADAFEEHPMVDHSDAVLKILMLPEFFLRGPHGAFSASELLEDGLLIDLADRVRDAISRQEFSDYLFVFGTVIAARSPNDPRKPHEHALSGNEVLYYNFAPVYKGGPRDPHRYLVTKRYISTVDFLDRTTLPNPTNVNIRRYDTLPSNVLELLKERGTELVEDNVIEMDGLRIGLEICLDHRMGALWNSLQTTSDELVDIQLIVSAGMSIERGPNPVVPGGVVYLTDGEASSAACRRTETGTYDPDHVCRENVAGLKHIPMGGPGYSNFFALASCVDVYDPTLYQGYYSLYQPQGCANTLQQYGIHVMDEFKEYPPSIEIYPTVALPGNTYDD